MDETARAYATLGVAPGAPLGEVRKRYRALVRQWHPDRFAADPQGQAEAAVRMRAINDAFRCVAARTTVPQPGPDPRAPAAGRSYRPGRRLTREEIDRMVETMGNDGPLDWIVGLGDSWTEQVRRPVSRSRVALYIAGGAWFLAPIFAEIVGLVPVGGPAPFWIGALAGTVAFGLAMQLLPPK